MSRRKSHIRALIGALAVAAIAAPSAQAYPADTYAPVAQGAAAKTQDLRSCDAQDAVVRPRLAFKADAPPASQPLVSQPVASDNNGGSDIGCTDRHRRRAQRRRRRRHRGARRTTPARRAPHAHRRLALEDTASLPHAGGLAWRW